MFLSHMKDVFEMNEQMLNLLAGSVITKHLLDCEHVICVSTNAYLWMTERWLQGEVFNKQQHSLH